MVPSVFVIVLFFTRAGETPLLTWSFPMWFYAVLYKASLAYGDHNDVITSWNAVGILTELGLHIH